MSRCSIIRFDCPKRIGSSRGMSTASIDSVWWPSTTAMRLPTSGDGQTMNTSSTTMLLRGIRMRTAGFGKSFMTRPASARICRLYSSPSRVAHARATFRTRLVSVLLTARSTSATSTTYLWLCLRFIRLAILMVLIRYLACRNTGKIVRNVTKGTSVP